MKVSSNVMLRWTLASMLCALIGCGGAQTQATDEPPTTEAPPEVATEATPVVDQTSPPPEREQDEKPAPTPANTGRMAFVQCDAEQRPTACTKEHRPVCGEVDNGVRCITTPCDSTDQRNFSNGCTACADPNVVGHWPVACESLGNDTH